LNEALVIGYGNTLRRDDGVGVLAVRAITGKCADVQCIESHELLPEYAEQIAKCSTVIFIDAGLGRSRVTVSSVEPRTVPSGNDPHMLSPSSLMYMSLQLYGRIPSRSFLIALPAFDTSFGELLSPKAVSGIPECVRIVEQLLASD